MPRLLRQITVQDQLIAADGVQQFLLGVNPLSVLNLELRPLNDTGTLANYASYLTLCKALNKVTVSFLGQSIISARGEDLAALNWLRWGMVPWEANPDNVDNERRSVVLPLCLGKLPFHPDYGFPATLKGQLLLECDFDIADTGYDGLRFQVTSFEMLDAKPKEFERKLTVSQTFALGTNDVQLYPGNKNRGILLFGTTPYAGATPAPTWGRLRVLLDGVEHQYSGVDWESLYPEPALWGRTPDFTAHKHTLDAAVAGITETTSTMDIGDPDWINFAYLDFDPSRDDEWVLDTKGVTRFQLRVEAETADAARAMQVEAIPTSSIAA